MKTNTGLVEYARKQLGKPYWYGTFGNAASKALYDAKKKQYPKYYTWAYGGEKNVRVHDCVGLIKGYLWSKDADSAPKYTMKQDVSADGMRQRCKTSGTINTIPEIPGVLVFFEGHVGVYEGNGKVIEARGHAYGVVRTDLKARDWKWWGLCPYIEYPNTGANITVSLNVLKKGQKGKAVEMLQHLLKANGCKLPKYDTDADFGKETEDAVKQFQKKSGLAADGVVGARTWEKLLQ